MTKVTIDIRNIASSTHADDRVFFRAPVVREAPSGGLVNTANEAVTLTDGVGDVELTPGPVIVTFQCKGVADTSPKRGTVPDSGTVELSQVISGSFSYSPEVVKAAQAARDDAQDAAGQAKDYRDAAADSADEASTASSTAVSSASTAVTKADEAAASASTATTAASSASTSASQAATSRDQAVQAATDTVSALDGRIPADLALRLDTTLGTRVFAGDTMIYGHTGERSVWDLTLNVTVEPDGLQRFARLWRVGDMVTMSVSAVYDGSSTLNVNLLADALPYGFRPLRFHMALGQMRTGTTVATVGTSYSYTRISALVTPALNTLVVWQATWRTPDGWPTTLPGTPA